MKNIFITTVTFLLAIVGLQAANTTYNRVEQPFVFNEAGIEFAVFQDGQFDFNVLSPSVGVHVDTRYLDFSFNTGHNYDAFVQYDSYGAPIQIENTPIYYDYYGRVSQIGSVNLNYNNFGYVNQIGSLYVSYTPRGYYNGTRGFINRYNRNIVFQSRYNVYCRPAAARVILHSTPYRRDFRPVRSNYVTYRKNYNNRRVNNRVVRNFRRPGAKVVVGNSRKATNRVAVNNRRSNNRVVANNNRNNNNKQVVNRNTRNTRTYSPRAQQTSRVSTTRNNTTTNIAGNNNRGGNNRGTTVSTPKKNNNTVKATNRTNKSSRAVASNDNVYRRR